MKIKIDIEVTDSVINLIEEFGLYEVSWVHKHMDKFDPYDTKYIYKIYKNPKFSRFARLFSLDTNLVDQRIRILKRILEIGWKTVNRDLIKISTNCCETFSVKEKISNEN